MAGHLRIAIATGLLLLLTLPAAGGEFPPEMDLYTTNNGTITITGRAAGGDVTIASTIDGLPVTSIGDGAFSDRNFWLPNVTSVTIPDSVTSIGNSAFGGCFSLTAITVDAVNPAYSSVDGVLFNKSQTTLVAYPGGKAGSYTIPNSVTSIGNYAFLGWQGLLTSVTIPNSVTSMGDGAFKYCGGLTNITIGNSVTSIGNSAFSGCYNLTSITIPNSVTNLGNHAFYSCDGLTSVTIPNSVTNIGDYTFYGCYSLTNITIPNSVTTIGDLAFFWCYSLINVTIPNGVTNIGERAFGGCTSLTGVYFKGNAPSVYEAPFYSAEIATVYYLPGTTGWGATFSERPTALWSLPYPLILDNGPSFGVQTNGFGFIISWATNVPVVVEASTSLANPIWSPVATNTLASGSFYFSDPQWTNYPGRFYRLRSP